MEDVHIADRSIVTDPTVSLLVTWDVQTVESIFDDADGIGDVEEKAAIYHILYEKVVASGVLLLLPSRGVTGVNDILMIELEDPQFLDPSSFTCCWLFFLS